ncbi:hypothetical protein MCERHM63_00828 [Candidatus Methylopumilus planktonicus]|jgi:hypothetical protein|uniref:hypothetical protein n=1 Tax=Candidatus Methylopumilus planktonicus TaxID=1581557 RepID=UPI003BEF1234
MKIILIGKNSGLYRNFKLYFDGFIDEAISHRDLHKIKFSKSDVLIILSFTFNKNSQDYFINLLKKTSASQVIVFSTAACLVSEKIKCYAYPDFKLQSEKNFMKAIPETVIFRFGTIIDYQSRHFYRGTYVTEISDVVNAIKSAIKLNLKSKVISMYSFCKFTNKNSFEYLLYKFYCKLILRMSCPCLLRPLDLILRLVFGYKWYGYGALSVAIGKLSNNEKNI